MPYWRLLFPFAYQRTFTFQRPSAFQGLFILALLMSPRVFGQEVVSARAGMVHFTQGEVFIDDQQLDRKSGSFPGIKEGSTLRTGKGRAEILLTPGAFLRLDENSSVRMVSTELADARLMFLEGSAILDLTDARENNAITITYKDARARFPKKGVYRLDSDTGVLQTYSGEANVTYAGEQTKVDASHLFFCWLGLQTNKLGNGTEDEFYDWASDRNQAITEGNQLAEQTSHDPGDGNPDPSAQLGAGVVPYLGSPRLASPSIGPRVYPTPYGGYAMGSTLFNPFLSFAPTPYLLTGYPILVVQRHYRNVSSQWPHSGNRPLWHPVTAGAIPTVPQLPGRSLIPGPILGYRPTTPRIGAATLARPSGPVGAHPVPMHAIGRR